MINFVRYTPLTFYQKRMFLTYPLHLTLKQRSCETIYCFVLEGGTFLTLFNCVTIYIINSLYPIIHTQLEDNPLLWFINFLFFFGFPESTAKLSKKFLNLLSFILLFNFIPIVTQFDLYSNMVKPLFNQQLPI